MEVLEFCIIKNCDDRIDKVLDKLLYGITRSYIKLIYDQNHLFVNNKIPKLSQNLKYQDIIKIQLVENIPAYIPQKMSINIVYEDDNILIINKLPGIVVHPSPGHTSHTLLNGLLFKYKQLEKMGKTNRFGLVHRLDKDTSGLLIVAKDRETQRFLMGQFAKRKVEKKYYALVKGVFPYDKLRIDNNLVRDRVHRKKFKVSLIGKRALCEVNIVKRFKYASLLKITLHTGRTHQIRVQLSNLGYSILGDKEYEVYSKYDSILKKQFKGVRQMLHAKILGFLHPNKGFIRFNSMLPKDFLLVLKTLYNNKE